MTLFKPVEKKNVPLEVVVLEVGDDRVRYVFVHGVQISSTMETEALHTLAVAFGYSDVVIHPLRIPQAELPKQWHDSDVYDWLAERARALPTTWRPRDSMDRLFALAEDLREAVVATDMTAVGDVSAMLQELLDEGRLNETVCNLEDVLRFSPQHTVRLELIMSDNTTKPSVIARAGDRSGQASAERVDHALIEALQRLTLKVLDDWENS